MGQVCALRDEDRIDQVGSIDVDVASLPGPQHLVVYTAVEDVVLSWSKHDDNEGCT